VKAAAADGHGNQVQVAGVAQRGGKGGASEGMEGAEEPACLHLTAPDVIAMYVSRWEKAVGKLRRDLMEVLGLTATEEVEESSESLMDAIERALEEKYGVEFHPKLEDLNTFLSPCVFEALEAWEGVDPSLKSECRHALSQNKKEAEAKVKAWWAKRGGLAKLTAEKPSTAPIGNETILKIFDKVREDSGVPLRTWRFMSSKKCQCQVQEADDADTVAAHWNELKQCVANPSQVLLFHLQNHYSMIYAARENQADEGYGGKHLIRQVLVAKPGQQPCRWIDFATVRDTLLSWVGHAIIGIELEHSPVEMVVL